METSKGYWVNSDDIGRLGFYLFMTNSIRGFCWCASSVNLACFPGNHLYSTLNALFYSIFSWILYFCVHCWLLSDKRSTEPEQCSAPCIVKLCERILTANKDVMIPSNLTMQLLQLLASMPTVCLSQIFLCFRQGLVSQSLACVTQVRQSKLLCLECSANLIKICSICSKCHLLKVEAKILLSSRDWELPFTF